MADIIEITFVDPTENQVSVEIIEQASQISDIAGLQSALNSKEPANPNLTAIAALTGDGYPRLTDDSWELVPGGPGDGTSYTFTPPLQLTGDTVSLPNASTTAAGAFSAADKTKLDSITAGATANATDAQLRDRSTHTGTQPIASIAGLQAALDAKSDSTHAHPIAAVSGLQAALDAKAADSHAHAVATSSAAGFMSATDKAKLDGITAGATANATDAQLRDRATHTGNQPIASVTGLQAALDGKADASHTHSIAAVTGLQTALDSKQAASDRLSELVSGFAGASALWIPRKNAAGTAIEWAAPPANGEGASYTFSAPLQLLGDVVSLPAATTGAAGAMSATDKSKLDGITAGATANATDAQLRDRSTHTGTQAISTVTGLQAALDGKADGSHTHSIATITGLQAALDAKAAAVHTHAISDVSGLQGALDSKADGGHTHSAATTTSQGFMTAADKIKLNGIATGATANATDAQLRDRSTHTGTQPIASVSGLQTALDGKAATVHTHAISDVTGLQSALDGKQASSDRLSELVSGFAGASALWVPRKNAAGTGIEWAAPATGGGIASSTVATLGTGTTPGELRLCTDCLTSLGEGGLVLWTGGGWRTLRDGIVPTTNHLAFFRALVQEGTSRVSSRLQFAFSDQLFGPNSLGMAVVTSGSGASGGNQADFSIAHPGVAQISTGTAATGGATRGSISASLSGHWYAAWAVCVPNLSNSSNEFACRVGVSDGIIAASSAGYNSRGIGFIYDRANSTGALAAGSDNWIVRYNAGTPEYIDTGIPVAGSSSTFEFVEIYLSPTAHQLYLNNNLILNKTSGLFSGQTYSFSMDINKFIGTAARVFRFSWEAYGFYFPAAINRFAN